MKTPWPARTAGKMDLTNSQFDKLGYHLYLHWQSFLGNAAVTATVAVLSLVPQATQPQIGFFLVVIVMPKEPKQVYLIMDTFVAVFL